MTAEGTFEVIMDKADPGFSGTGGVSIGKMHLRKTYNGDLEGESQGEMLTTMTKIPGSAGYIALEQFIGKLRDQKGGFVLQHWGVMSEKGERLVLEIVPGSGSGDLKGISGSMEIIREGEEHIYRLQYEISKGSAL